MCKICMFYMTDIILISEKKLRTPNITGVTTVQFSGVVEYTDCISAKG